jgi:excisionase family DNA binding protein
LAENGRGALKPSILKKVKTWSFHMEDRWLSVDEIGIYLGVKRDTIYKWISEKGMPAHRVGRLWKFKRDEVDKWVKAGGAADKSRQDQAE